MDKVHIYFAMWKYFPLFFLWGFAYFISLKKMILCHPLHKALLSLGLVVFVIFSTSSESPEELIHNSFFILFFISLLIILGGFRTSEGVPTPRVITQFVSCLTKRDYGTLVFFLVIYLLLLWTFFSNQITWIITYIWGIGQIGVRQNRA